MTYRSSAAESYRRGATHVDKILNSTKPADLPGEQTNEVQPVINLETLGLTILPSLLLRVDQVIEESDRCARAALGPRDTGAKAEGGRARRRETFYSERDQRSLNRYISFNSELLARMLVLTT